MNPVLANYLADELSQPESVIGAGKDASTLEKRPKVATEKQPKDLTIPKFHRRVLVFDTETTGLMPKHKKGDPFPPDSAYPHIMQISWMLYNVATNEIEEVVDEYVSIGKDVPIDPGSTAVTGITREVTETKGKPLAPLLIRFYLAYMKCDCIVAHNLQFDGEMVRKEMWRNRAGLLAIVKDQERVNMMSGVFTKRFNTAYQIDTFCTMMNTIDLCGITFPPKILAAPILSTEVGEENIVREAFAEPDVKTEPIAAALPTIGGRKKFPRLEELYKTLFESSPPTDLHNSIIDVLVCLRCFLKVRGAKEMTEKYFMRLVSQYSRPSEH